MAHNRRIFNTFMNVQYSTVAGMGTGCGCSRAWHDGRIPRVISLEPHAVIQYDRNWLLFRNPVGIVTAKHTADVLPALIQVQEAVGHGLSAAGFVSYEAASGLDPAMPLRPTHGFPLVWFGLFQQPETPDPAAFAVSPDGDCGMGEWEPTTDADHYAYVLSRIKSYLAAGDTYQVNFSIRFRTKFAGDPWRLFLKLQAAQKGGYGGFVETRDYSVCSASPELFFTLHGATLTSRPMKGTAPRGLSSAQDSLNAETLRSSAKNRAENVMIVDMIRNDMGRIAQPGSVTVDRLFDIEQYPTVLQMTSTVSCKTSAPFADIMQALFPCASVTGAPKIRTMHIIDEMEASPRGVYTGCVGCILPGHRASFNVAIRTVVVNKDRGRAEYGSGGGIVWDSDMSGEYEECRIKTGILTATLPSFELVETLLWHRKDGYFLADLHMARLAGSVKYFDFSANMDAVRRRLADVESAMRNEVMCKVRLLLSADGAVNLSWEPVSPPSHPWKVALAPAPVDSDSVFFYHKTTRRDAYERARKDAADADDVILWNKRNEITESCLANVVVEKDGRRVTPPVKCGLLPGVFREHLLKCGEIEEAVVTLEDLENADHLFLVNSVRKWIPAVLAR